MHINQVIQEKERKAVDKEHISIKVRKRKLERLFRSDLNRIKAARVPFAIINAFACMEEEVIEVMLSIWVQKYPEKTLDSLHNKGIHLGLPVIHHSYMGIYALMQLLKFGYKSGYTHLNPNFITNDVMQIPEKPYFIFDVEDGRRTVKTNSRDAKEAIEDKGRFCMVTDEIISIGILTDALQFHGLLAAGSSYASDGMLGIVMRNQDIFLACIEPGNPIKKWGVPSCGKRSCVVSEI